MGKIRFSFSIHFSILLFYSTVRSSGEHDFGLGAVSAIGELAKLGPLLSEEAIDAEIGGARAVWAGPRSGLLGEASGRPDGPPVGRLDEVLGRGKQVWVR